MSNHSQEYHHETNLGCTRTDQHPTDQIPEHLVPVAQSMGCDVTGDSRFFAYKAGIDFIGHFFEIGTRASQLG